MRCVSHLAVAIVVYLSALTLSAQGPTDTLDIYWIDVEGGAATLIVTPAQESVLMDAGWARSDDRDVLRIQAAMRNANSTGSTISLRRTSTAIMSGDCPRSARASTSVSSSTTATLLARTMRAARCCGMAT